MASNRVHPWFKTAYRRGVIDMHITDHDERFMASFDPDAYLSMLLRAKVQSVVMYAHSHVGLCYYPTKIGTMHKGLLGRDILADLIEKCHDAGICVVVYLSAIFDTEAYKKNPDWRIITVQGEEASPNGRYGVCCPNAPYRDYIAGLAREVCEGYNFEGVRFDMTFWPRVCYCRHCQGRYMAEVGDLPPRIIDWEDPRWVSFQRRRETWLVEFAAHLTNAVKTVKKDVTVEHQASTYIADWQTGVTIDLSRASDFLQGDFYGDAVQGSFARKLFLGLSENQPYGFETCVSVDLANYTVLKSEALLRAKASAALADGGAFVFIDSIDPTGTLNEAAYERMGKVFEATSALQEYAGGTPCHDVAVYLNTACKCDLNDKGKRVDGSDLTRRAGHVEAALSACQSLMESHIPFGVITKRNLEDLGRYRAVVLPNSPMMDEEETEAIRRYVAGGGALYASKHTSRLLSSGGVLPDFALGDVFGASYAGETEEPFTYLCPLEEESGLLEGYTAAHPAGLEETQLLVVPSEDTRVLARISLPYTNPRDPHHFASIHNNPAGRRTEHPGIVQHAFGKGHCIYAACELERAEPHREIFIALIRRLLPCPSFGADAPKSVEVTLFHQPGARRYVLSCLNFQKDSPNIPVRGVRAHVRVPEGRVRAALLVPEKTPVPFDLRGDAVHVEVPEIETLRMIVIEYD